MENKTKKRTGQILKVMHVLAWIAFIGLAIEGGVFLTTYTVSCINPEAAKNLYRGLNLYNLLQFSFFNFSLSIFFIVLLFAMKAWIVLLIIRILSKVNLENPFKYEVANIIEKISYILLGTCVLSSLHNIQLSYLSGKVSSPLEDWDTGQFLFMAGLIFIFSQIFKRGVAIQKENDLTV